MNKALAPVAFFCFNRPDHTLKTLSAIKNNQLSSETILYIFSDGPRKNDSLETIEKIREVRKIIRKEQWCKEVVFVEAERNQGLLQSISKGVTEVVNRHGKVIVIEDDVMVSKGFLNFMNKALDMYEKDEKVMHLGGYSPLGRINYKPEESTFFYNHTFCWGWATWQRAWKYFSTDGEFLRKRIKKEGKMRYINLDDTFEAYWGIKYIMEGRFQSWNYFWHTCVNLNGGLCLHPAESLIENIGFDGSGTNCEIDTEKIDSVIADHLELVKIPIVENAIVRKKMHTQSIFSRLRFNIRHYLKYILG